MTSRLPTEPDFPQILTLVRISVLVGLREEARLKSELQRALQENVPIVWIREAILQSYLFAGYAAAINAFIFLNELAGTSVEFLEEEDASLDLWKKRGEELCRQIYGQQFEKLMQNMKRLHPELAGWMLLEGYGKVLARPFFSPRVRELLIVGMTATLQVERQFHSHTRGALHVGATPAELREVLKEVGANSEYKAILESLLS